MEEMTRTLKLDLEERVGVRVSVNHPIFPWVVEHAVDLLNKILIGVDGRTADQRRKGKKYSGDMYSFCTPPCSGWQER